MDNGGKGALSPVAQVPVVLLVTAKSVSKQFRLHLIRDDNQLLFDLELPRGEKTLELLT